jgi:DNA-binding response OmpR family regulator
MRDETDQTANVVRLADRVGRDFVRVLYVEEDALCREAIAGDLSDHGFLVHEFADVASLTDALDSAFEADVILLDWGLPSTLGIDLLPELRRSVVDLPVVFLTGYTFDAQENAALERGPVDFVDKAGSMDVIVARLRRAVGIRSKQPLPQPA